MRPTTNPATPGHLVYDATQAEAGANTGRLGGGVVACKIVPPDEKHP
jgi:hypothetical protein